MKTFICTDCRWPIAECTCHDPNAKRAPASVGNLSLVTISECPFCDNRDCEVAESEVPGINGGKKQAVFCPECFCEGPTADTQQEAIELWDTRANKGETE